MTTHFLFMLFFLFLDYYIQYMKITVKIVKIV